ncbi:hypothetical protein EJB05_12662, partial [Eragrostis curvula]
MLLHPMTPRRKCQRLEDGDEGDGVDRLSDLSDDVLLDIIDRLCSVHAAARTSILSRRWRGLWTGLSEVVLDVDPCKAESVLTQLALPMLKCLDIYLNRWMTPRQLSAILCVAARLAPEKRFAISTAHRVVGDDTIQLPCFYNTTALELDMVGAPFTLPQSGEFTALRDLSLTWCRIDPAALLAMCPSLRVLEINDCCALTAVTVHSSSLEKLSLCGTQWEISSIDIAAPELKELKLDVEMTDEFSASILVPMLQKLDWDCSFPDHNVGVGELWRLRSICERKIYGYHVVSMYIYCDPYRMDTYRSFEQVITQLPVTKFTVLELDFLTEGHVFGSLALHLLRIQPVIQKLKIVIGDHKEKEPCPISWPCEQPNNWRDESVALMDLEMVEIVGFTGKDHENDFIRLLFRGATMLKSMVVRVSYKVSLSDNGYKKLCEIFREYHHGEGYSAV